MAKARLVRAKEAHLLGKALSCRGGKMRGCWRPRGASLSRRRWGLDGSVDPLGPSGTEVNKAPVNLCEMNPVSISDAPKIPDNRKLASPGLRGDFTPALLSGLQEGQGVSARRGWHCPQVQALQQTLPQVGPGGPGAASNEGCAPRPRAPTYQHQGPEKGAVATGQLHSHQLPEDVHPGWLAAGGAEWTLNQTQTY